jgi:hypothetical protein
MPVPVIVIESAINARVGLCIREDVAMRLFLNQTGNGWFYRAIDDTWIHPENLREFVEDLLEVINPMIHIVIKACKTYHQEYHCGPWMDGGIGWLLSRAAVMHTLEYNFIRLCGSLFVYQDDVSMGMIACHTFPDHRFWHSWRMPGNPFYHTGQWPIIRDDLPACPNSGVWPLWRLVALHSQDNKAIWDAVRNATFTERNLAYTVDRQTWRLCRGNASAMAASTGKEELRKWTPVLLFRKGGQQIPWVTRSRTGPKACAQCTGLSQTMQESEEKRIALWNQTGWKDFYKLLNQR